MSYIFSTVPYLIWSDLILSYLILSEDNLKRPYLVLLLSLTEKRYRDCFQDMWRMSKRIDQNVEGSIHMFYLKPN